MTSRGRPLLDLHLDGLRVREAIGPLDRVLHRRQLERHPRLLEEGEVELAGLRGDAPLVAAQEQRVAAEVLGALRRWARRARRPRAWGRRRRRPRRSLQPAADRAQRVLARLRDHAVGHRPHVQQVVAALADDVDQLEDHVARRLPVVVVLAIAPGVVDRRGHLPGGRLHVGRDDVVAGRHVVARGAEPAVDQRLRLERAHDVGEALRALGRSSSAACRTTRGPPGRSR